MKRTSLILITALLLCGCNKAEPAETTAPQAVITSAEASALASETVITTVTEAAETETIGVSAPEAEKTDGQKQLEELIISAANEQGMYDDSFVIHGQLFGDFDGDGTEELTAVYGDRNKALFEDLCHGAVWFASGGKAECLTEEFDWLAPRLVTSDGKSFIKLEKCYVSDSSSRYFIIENDTVKAVPMPVVQGLYPDGEYGDFTGVQSAYDMSVAVYEDGGNPISTGHTWKTYWYYLMDGSIYSYYAEELTEDEFLAYEGAQEQLYSVYKEGREVKSILKWGSGIITVSWQKHGENGDSEGYSFGNIVLDYRGKKVFPHADEYDNNGFYLNPDYSEITAFDRCMIKLYDSAEASPEDRVKERAMTGDTLYASYCGKLWRVNESSAEILEESTESYDDFPQYIKERITQ